MLLNPEILVNKQKALDFVEDRLLVLLQARDSIDHEVDVIDEILSLFIRFTRNTVQARLRSMSRGGSTRLSFSLTQIGGVDGRAVSEDLQQHSATQLPVGSPYYDPGFVWKRKELAHVPWRSSTASFCNSTSRGMHCLQRATKSPVESKT